MNVDKMKGKQNTKRIRPPNTFPKQNDEAMIAQGTCISVDHIFISYYSHPHDFVNISKN